MVPFLKLNNKLGQETKSMAIMGYAHAMCVSCDLVWTHRSYDNVTLAWHPLANDLWFGRIPLPRLDRGSP